MALVLSEAEILSRMKNFEDHFVERKTSGEKKRDWVKTVVAFANSAPIDYPCILFLGVRDDGEVEVPQINLDSLQKSFNQEMSNIYPRVPYLPKIVVHGGRQALAIIVPGSPSRPHFAGPSFIRNGPETVEASEEQFQHLISLRNSKVYRISQYVGRPVSFVNCQSLGNGQIVRGTGGSMPVVRDCNEFWLTLDFPNATTRSFPLADVQLNFNHQIRSLQLEVVTRDY